MCQVKQIKPTHYNRSIIFDAHLVQQYSTLSLTVVVILLLLQNHHINLLDWIQRIT